MSDRIRIADDLGFSGVFPNTAKVISSNNLEICSQVLSSPTLNRVMNGFDIHLADGRGFQLMYWMTTGRWPPKHSGSDVYRGLVELSVDIGKGVLVFGGSERANSKAIENLKAEYGGQFIGISPPAGTSLKSSADALVNCLNDNDIGVCLVCFGAPKQEYLAHLARRFCRKNVIYLCAGGTVDFIAGDIARAPRWMQVAGLEWVFRTMLQPRVRGPRILKALRILASRSRKFPTHYA